MDETRILKLISGGENDSIDFKRELNLNSADKKAEFIKDVISLANSTIGSGYILIGVDDDGTIFGTAKIEEERIQQITSTYINPAVSIKCSLVEMTVQGLLLVAVIEIRGIAKPHKVIRAIDKLQQNDVFVRHGSVVSKASPEEMFQMRETSRIDEERRHYIRAAQTHLKLGDLEKAIEAYTKAIEILPTADILLIRAKLYEQQAGKNYDENTDHIANLALKDIGDALKLADTLELEKEARITRLRIHSNRGYYLDETDDLNWLKTHMEGRERGEVLFLEWNGYENLSGWLSGWDDKEPQKTLEALNEMIRLGYTEPRAYYLRALVHFKLYNSGLALEDVDQAINTTPSSDELAEYLCLKARILSEMRRFEEVYQTLSQARQISKDTLQIYGHGYFGQGELDYLIRNSIAYNFELLDEWDIQELRSMFQTILYLAASRRGGIVYIGGSPFSRATISAIRRIVGEEFWEEHKDRLQGYFGKGQTKRGGK